MNKSEINKRFTKPVLLDIALEELGVEKVTPKMHVYRVIQAIKDDLITNGIPDEEISDELFDLMVVWEFITKEGDIIEAEPESEPKQEASDNGQEKPVEKLPDELPKCWGWGDPEDPACAECPFSDACNKRREENTTRMLCFGLLCDDDTEECQMCIVWKFCRKQSETLELEKEQ